MTKEQISWKECLVAERSCEINDLRRKEIWSELEARYKGKTKEQLAKIWTSKFKTITEEYFQDTNIYPDAFGKSDYQPRDRKKWQPRYDSKRKYFMNKILIGEGSPKGVKVVSSSVLISRLADTAYEIINRHETFTVAQMKKVLRIHEEVLNCFHKYHKDEIKGA